MQYDLPALRKQIIETHSDNELKDLCFDMAVDYEIIEGPEKSSKARELLTYLERRDRIPELIQYCTNSRPNKTWNLVKTQTEKSEEFRQKLGLGDEIRNRYLDQQYSTYCSIWASLYALKEAGDALWESASKENIANFASLLIKAKKRIGENAIFFDKEDYEALNSIITRFGHFHAGKMHLSAIRSVDHEHYIKEWTRLGIQEQIDRNGKLKAAYEELLSNVLDSFRIKIANPTTK